jgi:hypothetical protein
VACAGTLVYIIVDDVNKVWLSARSVAKYLGLARPSSVVEAFADKDHIPPAKDRGSFPVGVRNSNAPSVQVHEFVLAQFIFLALKQKYHKQLSELLGCVLMFLARRASDATKQVEALALDPIRRSSRSLSLTSARREVHIKDVAAPLATPVPPPSFVATTVPPDAPARAHFLHIEYSPGVNQSPFFARRRGAPVRVDRVLRSSLRSSFEAPAQNNGVAEAPSDHSTVQLVLYRRVLQESGLSGVFRGKRMTERVGPIASSRSIHEIEYAAKKLNHVVEFCGDIDQFGRFSWTIGLDCEYVAPAVRTAKRFFCMEDSFVLYVRGQGEREWFGCSEWINKEHMQRIMNQLLVEPLPLPKPHADFANSGFDCLAKRHPWLLSHESSLTKSEEAVLLPARKVLLVTAEGLNSLLSTACCKKAKLVCSSVVSLEVNVVFQCEFCCIKTKSTSLVPDIVNLNKMAFCARVMSGRGFSVDRFLSWLGIGDGMIKDRDNISRWIGRLVVAAEKVYNDCQQAVMQAFVLGNDPRISADVAYKRNAKAYQGLGAALSSLLSVCDNRLGKVLSVFIFERKKMEQEFLEKEKISVTSTVAGQPAVTTEYAAGGDHAAFELGLSLFHQEAKAACRNVAANAELVAAYANVAILMNDWKLASVIADAISSGANTVKRVFGDKVKLFIDWWHRRTSFKTELSKIEVGCLIWFLLLFELLNLQIG